MSINQLSGNTFSIDQRRGIIICMPTEDKPEN